MNLGPIKQDRKVPSSATLNELADRLRVDRKEIDAVLAEWSPERLIAHLGTFTEEQLKPPAYRKKG